MTVRRTPDLYSLPRQPQQRRSQRGQARDPIVLLGTVLVLTLVALLPLALALMPADAGAAESEDAAGIGSGVGELSAAALSALHRDLSAKRTGGENLPPPLQRVRPPFLAASSYPHERADTARLSSHDPSRRRSLAVSLLVLPPAGPGPDGIPLLL